MVSFPFFTPIAMLKKVKKESKHENFSSLEYLLPLSTLGGNLLSDYSFPCSIFRFFSPVESKLGNMFIVRIKIVFFFCMEDTFCLISKDWIQGIIINSIILPLNSSLLSFILQSTVFCAFGMHTNQKNHQSYTLFDNSFSTLSKTSNDVERSFLLLPQDLIKHTFLMTFWP